MQNVFAIYDSKAEAYLKPFFAVNHAVAIRSFEQAANEEGSDFHKFAADYTLFHIGAWDENTGELVPAHKTSLGVALEFIHHSNVTPLYERTEKS